MNRFCVESLLLAIEKINQIYDESNINLDRTIYVHVSMDPWNILGVTDNITNTTVSIYMKGKP